MNKLYGKLTVEWGETKTESLSGVSSMCFIFTASSVFTALCLFGIVLGVLGKLPIPLVIGSVILSIVIWTLIRSRLTFAHYIWFYTQLFPKESYWGYVSATHSLSIEDTYLCPIPSDIDVQLCDYLQKELNGEYGQCIEGCMFVLNLSDRTLQLKVE